LYALSATDLSLEAAYCAHQNSGFICSSPAVAYSVGAGGNRWVFVTARAEGERLLAFKILE